MDQQAGVAVIEATRRCPECAYVFEPFDTECPRCALRRAHAAHADAMAPAIAPPQQIRWENTSGTPGAAAPPEILGWNWGAFLLTPLWSIAHSVWIGLLCFIPYVGAVMPFVMGSKGSEWAWQNRRFESVQEFRDVQRAWMWWGAGINIGVGALVMLAIVLAIGMGAAGHAAR
jgi:hypothetical protein